jgi:hypothetical protein
LSPYFLGLRKLISLLAFPVSAAGLVSEGTVEDSMVDAGFTVLTSAPSGAASLAGVGSAMVLNPFLLNSIREINGLNESFVRDCEIERERERERKRES